MFVSGRLVPQIGDLYIWQRIINCVVVVMKIGNITPRARIESTSLALWACVLTISPSRLPDVATLPTPTCLYNSLTKTLNPVELYVC